MLGIDFGTSCVKAIVGDVETNHALAVPFTSAEGIERYLLPSRVWKTEERFSLSGGTSVHRDLKLNLLESADEQATLPPAVAFLALVVRHIRGWIFTEHGNDFRNATLVWRLRLGIPTEHFWKAPAGLLVARFQTLAHAAWICSCAPAREITTGDAQKAIRRTREIAAGSPTAGESEDVEIDVIPELAAQIYGFLRSDQFGNAARGRFMVVDVGAGTIDSSVFRVIRARRGKWDFEFYTTLVLQNGAVNLHRARVKWWLNALSSSGGKPLGLVDGLREAMLPTDFQTSIPDSFREYVQDTRITFASGRETPDDAFYRYRVLAQVRGKTFYRTRDFLEPDQHSGLKGTPMFLCGGASRMGFYHRLNSDMLCFPGISWLKATPRALTVPQALRAVGVLARDYDRLSVAYGLSFLNVGAVIRAMPRPKLPPLPTTERPDRDDLYPK